MHRFLDEAMCDGAIRNRLHRLLEKEKHTVVEAHCIVELPGVFPYVTSHNTIASRFSYPIRMRSIPEMYLWVFCRILNGIC